MSVNACVAFLIRAALVRGTTTNPGVGLSSSQPATCGFWEWQMPMCPVLQGMQTAPSHSVPYLVVHTSALQDPCVKLLWVSGCVRVTDPLMAPDPNLYLGPGIYLSLYPTNFIPLDKPLNPLNTPFQPHTGIPSVLSVSCSHAPYIPFQQGPSLSHGTTAATWYGHQGHQGFPSTWHIATRARIPKVRSNQPPPRTHECRSH